MENVSRMPPSSDALRFSAMRRDSAEKELNRIDRLASLLDARIGVPFTPFRIGLDGLVGLIPGVGDTITLFPAAYIIIRGWQLGARKRTLLKMLGTTATDYAIGLVPFAGDILDVGFKGNLRNAAMLRRELTATERPKRV